MTLAIIQENTAVGTCPLSARINIWSCGNITVVVLSDQCDGYNGALIWLSHAWMELWL